MNKAIKKISIWSLFFLIVLALSCVGIEEKFPSKQDPIISGEIASKKDLIQYAYQDYAFASIAIENGNFKDAEVYLREALKNDEDSPYLLMRLSQVLVENGKMAYTLPERQLTLHLMISRPRSSLQKFTLS